MPDTNNKGSLHIRFTGAEKWESFSFFDPNRFPEDLHRAAESCGDRFSLLIYYSESLKPQLEIDTVNFTKLLNTHVAHRNLQLDRHSECTATYHSVAHLAALHGMLTSLKALLDSLAFLWGRLVDPGCSIHTFTRKVIDGKDVSGGALLNWLRSSNPKKNTVAAPLADLLEMHSTGWITQAVKYRDNLLHGHGIRDLSDLLASIETTEHRFTSADVQQPTMPDGVTVAEYCEGLAVNIELLIKGGLEILAPKLKKL